MPPAVRFLQTTSGHLPVAEPPPPVDSDVVLILAAFICGLIIVVGLALVARCACLRRSLGAWLRRSSDEGPPPPPNGSSSEGPPPNGQALLRSLPKLSYEGAVTGGRLSDFQIYLAEFVEGDKIRILPSCGHEFHVGCVDTWLGFHSFCPSCRRVIIVSAASSLCHRSRAISAASSAAGSAAAEGGTNARKDGFLPEAPPIPF